MFNALHLMVIKRKKATVYILLHADKLSLRQFIKSLTNSMTCVILLGLTAIPNETYHHVNISSVVTNKRAQWCSWNNETFNETGRWAGPPARSAPNPKLGSPGIVAVKRARGWRHLDEAVEPTRSIATTRPGGAPLALHHGRSGDAVTSSAAAAAGSSSSTPSSRCFSVRPRRPGALVRVKSDSPPSQTPVAWVPVGSVSLSSAVRLHVVFLFETIFPPFPLIVFCSWFSFYNWHFSFFCFWGGLSCKVWCWTMHLRGLDLWSVSISE